MRVFLTSDCHFNHTNIIKYCNRPFKTVEEMNEKLIKNWNERVKKDDTVIHLGDFCFKERDSLKYTSWESQLNGRIIHVRGNHDNNNSTKTPLLMTILQFSNLLILARHHPPREDNWMYEMDTTMRYDFVACGHVHQNWQSFYHQKLQKWVINVGVDVWKFRPVLLDEVVGLYHKLKNSTPVNPPPLTTIVNP